MFISPLDNRGVIILAFDLLLRTGHFTSQGHEIGKADDHHPSLFIAPILYWSSIRSARVLLTSLFFSGVHLLTKQNMTFNSDPAVYAAKTVPTLDDWKGVWAVWDLVTRGMIPDEELAEKPIKLRNACIFYLGHIPTFLDIQLAKATKLALCEPSYYPHIFERGIDPDVDNPEQCHDHSEIPDEWPPLDEILAYQQQVRVKVQKLYENPETAREVDRKSLDRIRARTYAS